MKKEIEKLLNEGGRLKLSDWCELCRWTEDALGNEVDCLCAEFSILHSCDHTYNIKSRDWQGIILEVQIYYKDAFETAGYTLADELKSGYLRKINYYNVDDAYKLGTSTVAITIRKKNRLEKE